MTEEMEYMNISQYCLNLIKNNLKQFFETKYKKIIEEEYKSSSDSFYDVMFYFSVLKDNINQIKDLPKVIINTVHSLKIFRNKIAHQVPITLREFYRFVDDTQIIIELLNISDKNEITKIENTRKEIIKRMNILDDNKFIIGTNYNSASNNNLNMIKFSSDSDIEMGDYDDNFSEKVQNNYNNEKNYNNFNQIQNNNQNNILNNNEKINDDEKERKRKIEKNYEEIMKNNDKKNFMTVKKVEF
jgi:hypothetical protein